MPIPSIEQITIVVICITSILQGWAILRLKKRVKAVEDIWK